MHTTEYSKIHTEDQKKAPADHAQTYELREAVR